MEKIISVMMCLKEVRKMPGKLPIPRNPNKRPCVARNITFPVQKENEYWIRLLSSKNRIN